MYSKCGSSFSRIGKKSRQCLDFLNHLEKSRRCLDFSIAVPLFPLSWSHYVRLLSLKSDKARQFYEEEILRGGWSVRQLDRQIATQFYERARQSKRKLASRERLGDQLSAQEEIKDPFVLEFLGLKNEYSGTELERALILHLEHF